MGELLRISLIISVLNLPVIRCCFRSSSLASGSASTSSGDYYDYEASFISSGTVSVTSTPCCGTLAMGAVPANLLGIPIGGAVTNGISTITYTSNGGCNTAATITCTAMTNSGILGGDFASIYFTTPIGIPLPSVGNGAALPGGAPFGQTLTTTVPCVGNTYRYSFPFFLLNFIPFPTFDIATYVCFETPIPITFPPIPG